MALPVPFTPPRDATASGFGPMPGAFSGQARDFPGPVEFAPQPAVQLLETKALPLPVLFSPPAGIAPPVPAELMGTADLLSPGPPMVPAETAFNLQELADALARPLPAPTVPPEASAAENFSLTALAEQLHARFSQGDPRSSGSADLLSPASLPSLPPVLESPPEALSGLAALLPSLGLKPPAPATPKATHAKLANPPKPNTPRQGDVFFIDPLAGRPHGHGDAPPGLLEPAPSLRFETDPVEALEALDLMDAPHPEGPLSPAALFRAAPRVETEGLLPPPLPLGASVPPGEAAEAGTGLIIGGTGLILIGIYLACRLPIFWLELEGAEGWTRQKNEAALVIHGAAALTALALGTGSVSLRRWAPPLIHAAGWVAALMACGIIAVAGFSWVHSESDLPETGTAALPGLLAAFLIPLGYILYYQQESTTAACEAADPRLTWTDGLPVPALMVFLTGLSLATGAAALLCHQPALGLPPGQLITGLPATLAWSGLAVTGLIIALCVRFRKAAAIWLLLLATLALAGTLSPPAWAGGWLWDRFLSAMGRPTDAGPTAPLVPLLAALLPVPLLLIFAMARRAFSPPPPP